MEKLDAQKLPQVLVLKYGGIPDALEEIDKNEEMVQEVFYEFKNFLRKEAEA